ncbi:hypothetical protein [Kocuria palustris]|nr:hypothetical protein [Kocuria palustris]MBM7823897.1 hypothetical protein [Kocuria palustris]
MTTTAYSVSGARCAYRIVQGLPWLPWSSPVEVGSEIGSGTGSVVGSSAV